MRSTEHINIRVEAEYAEMLEELLRDEAKNAMRFKRSPMNKTQLNKAAIEEYYESRMNGSASNIHADLSHNSIEPMLMSLFKTMDERQSILFKKLERMNQKELLYLEFLLMESEHKTNKEENQQVKEKLMDSEYSFEDAVKKKLHDYLSEKQ